MPTTEYTADQLALQEFVREQNRATQAWIDESPDTRGGGMRIEDLDVLASWGIFSIEDSEKRDLCDNVYYGTKDKWGYKPDYSKLEKMSIEELRAELANI